MKKLLILLFAMVLLISGCQKKQITAQIGYSDGDETGGMRAEMPENSTLKDMFDELSKGTDFVYELDDEGYITKINGKENDEFGRWEITVNGDLINDVIGNITVKDNDVCDIKYIATDTTELLGGWQIAEVARTDLDDKEAENFNKAMEVVLGEEYEPVTVLATQVVSGTNYAYLAQGTVVSNKPVSDWCIIKIYEDLEGNVSLTSISNIGLLDIKTRENVDDEIVGGWEIKDTGKPGTLGSAEAQASFDKATAELLGVGYNPIQLLATQVVSGTNYLALVRGRAVSVDDSPELYIMNWYEDLNGNSEVTGIQKFDLNYYVD